MKHKHAELMMQYAQDAMGRISRGNCGNIVMHHQMDGAI